VSEVPSKKVWLLSIICIAILELILYLLPITKFIMAVATVLAGPLIFFASFKWHLKEEAKLKCPGFDEPGHFNLRYDQTM